MAEDPGEEEGRGEAGEKKKGNGLKIGELLRKRKKNVENGINGRIDTVEQWKEVVYDKDGWNRK